jgi:hypothetical protein
MEFLSPNFAAILGIELATMYFEESQADGPRSKLWHELETREGDLFAVKSGASRFSPGKCDLQAAKGARYRHADHRRNGNEYLLRVVGP